MTPTEISADQILRALQDGELVFHYQPYVSLLTGRLAGAEALLRWPRSDGHLWLPSQFLPVAERSGVITEITLHMLPRLIADWFVLDGMDPSTALSLNISSKDLQTDSVIQLIAAAIARDEIDPHRLGIEITESSLLMSSPQVRTRMDTLVEMGISLIMDDFGKGFSSIDSLSQWPFTCIKLDRDLIRRMSSSHKSLRIVSATVRMAHELGISVVAEGVHSPACYEFLLRSGCSRAQGNWISPALPLSALLEFMQQDHEWSLLPEGLLHLAQLDHIQWRRALITAVTRMAFGKDSHCDDPLAKIPEMDHHKCGLGQWYDTAGQRFIGSGAFQRLDPAHRHLHELGRALVDAARDGADHSRLTQLMQRLSDTSIEVIGLLQELENGAALNVHKQVIRHGLCAPP